MRRNVNETFVIFMLPKLNVQIRPPSFGHDFPAFTFRGRHSHKVLVYSPGMVCASGSPLGVIWPSGAVGNVWRQLRPWPLNERHNGHPVGRGQGFKQRPGPPHSKEPPGPKCQQCWGWKSLLCAHISTYKCACTHKHTYTPAFLYTSGRHTTHFIFSFSLNRGDCSVSAQTLPSCRISCCINGHLYSKIFCTDSSKLQNILLYKWPFICSASCWETFRLFPASTNNTVVIILLHLLIFGCPGFGCSAWGEWGLLVAPVVQPGLQAVTARFSSYSAWSQQLGLVGSWTWAQRLWCMGLVAPLLVGSSGTWIEPVSPALAGGFLSAVPPGSPVRLWFSFTDARVRVLSACYSLWVGKPDHTALGCKTLLCAVLSVHAQ